MSAEDKIAEWNESYTDWLMNLDEWRYHEEDYEKQDLDDEELSYYVRKG